MNILSTSKVEDFWFVMLDDEAKLSKKKWNDVISTKNICVQLFIAFFLKNKKSIIYKEEGENWNKR